MNQNEEQKQLAEDLRTQLLDPTGEQSDLETLRSLDFLEKRLRALFLKIQDALEPKGRAVAFRNLSRYAGWLVLMLRQSLGSPIELYGWISRSLFELKLLVKYVSLSEENMRCFGEATATDEIAILEGIMELPTDQAAKSATGLRTTVAKLQEAAPKTVSTGVRLPAIAEIAQQVGSEREYRAFYKLYSKYVHPSAWTVNAEVAHVRAPVFQKIFLLQAQFNAHEILRSIDRETGLLLSGDAGSRPTEGQ